MDVTLSGDRQAIRDSVLQHCSAFGDDYRLEHDRSGEFPRVFHDAMADAGWLGIAMAERMLNRLHLARAERLMRQGRRL